MLCRLWTKCGIAARQVSHDTHMGDRAVSSTFGVALVDSLVSKRRSEELVRR